MRQRGIVMRHLPPKVADVMAAPMVAVTVGDVSKGTGLRKLPYGPNTQIANDRSIPLLDIGTMEHVRAGRIRVHPGIERFTATGVVFTDGTWIDVDAVVLATGYEPALADLLPEWRAVCDDSGRPRISGGPTALPRLYFVGQFVAPSGMLREMGIEARRVAADISGRRGQLMGTDTDGRKVIINALIPQLELARYAIDLRGIAQGAGTFTREFHGYELLPGNLVEKFTQKD